ncbi:MAG: ImmA/IrrE family metallo-endopeptidase [Polyangiaceae bacterium]
MRSASEAMAEARASLNLSLTHFAQVVGVSPDVIERVDADSAARTLALRNTAEIFGLDVAELLADGVAGRLPTAMLRSFVDHAPDAFDDLIAADVHRKLGAFTRLLRRKSWLRQMLGMPQQPSLPGLRVEPRPIPEGSRTPHGADALAIEARAQLGLGDNPIPSMLALVRDRLGVEVHFTSDLGPRIDGASVSTGRVRGVLVNLGPNGGHKWWMTRMTLAHELCHLLFDAGVFDGARGLLIWSPATRRASEAEGWEPRLGAKHSRFKAVEQRANAFAAYFLAPPSGVRALFPDGIPDRTWPTVSRVANHFGLSPLTAVNVLVNVFTWNRRDREDLLEEIDGEGAPVGPHPDAVSDVPEANAELRQLMEDAVQKRFLLPATRDRWLGGEPAALAPRPAPRPLRPDAAGMEVSDLIRAGRVDGALRVLWDSVDAWIDEGDLDACRSLLGMLTPDTVPADIMVSLLCATARAPELAEARARYRVQCRDALHKAGHNPTEIDALVAPPVDDGR